MKTTKYITPEMVSVELGSGVIAQLTQVSTQATGSAKYNSSTDEGDLVKGEGAWDDEW